MGTTGAATSTVIRELVGRSYIDALKSGEVTTASVHLMPRRGSAWLFCLLLVYSCGGAEIAGPTVPPTLRIEAPTSINVGVTKTVRASMVEAGQARAVAPTWDAEPSSALAISGTSITGLSPARAVLTARYEGLEATASVSVVPNVRGTWLAQITRTECVRESGPGSTPCRFAAGFAQPFRLSMTNDGATIGGSIRVFDVVLTGPVTGFLGVDGRLTLSATAINEGITVTITEWSSTFDRGVWTPDSLHWRRSFTNAFGPQVLKESWQFSQIRRE